MQALSARYGICMNGSRHYRHGACIAWLPAQGMQSRSSGHLAAISAVEEVIDQARSR
jgi:hypothetical protein